METMDIEIFEVVEVNNDLVVAMEQLVQQLSNSNIPPDFEALERIVASDATVLLVATDGGVIVGTMTLVLFRIPTGLRAWIEDVVVDEQARGKGIGEACAIALADAGAELVLVSRTKKDLEKVKSKIDDSGMSVHEIHSSC